MMKTTIVSRRYNSNVWDTISRITKAFDGESKLLSEQPQTYSNGNWHNQNKVLYTYNPTDSLASKTNLTWTGTEWVPLARDVYTYALNGHLTHHLRESFDGTAWQNETQELITYSQNNDTAHWMRQSWNNLMWENISRGTNIFDAQHNHIAGQFDQWNGTEWVPESRLRIAEYNAFNKFTNWLSDNWTGTDWKKTWQQTATYDVNGFRKSAVTKQWWATPYVETGDSSYTYFQTLTAIPENRPATELTVYPNPTTGNIRVEVEPHNQQAKLKVFNAAAQLIYSEQLTSTTHTTIQLPPTKGIYLIRVESLDGSIREKKIVRN